MEGLYGSIRGTDMDRIFGCMKAWCGLDEGSHVVDVGSGLCRPLLHAMVSVGVRDVTGVEVDRVKCIKAEAFCDLVKKKLGGGGKEEGWKNLGVEPKILCSSVEAMESLDPATHAYSFWEGVPVEARMGFGRLCSASKTLTCVTVVQRSMRNRDPVEEMQEYGFHGLDLVDSFRVCMSGSGRSFMAYVFARRPADLRGGREGSVVGEARPMVAPSVRRRMETGSKIVKEQYKEIKSSGGVRKKTRLGVCPARKEGDVVEWGLVGGAGSNELS